MDDELAPLLGWALMNDPLLLLSFLYTLQGVHHCGQRQQLIEALTRFSEAGLTIIAAEEIANSAFEHPEEEAKGC